MTGFIYHNEKSFNLIFLDFFNIENKAKGLKEPSGLALSHEGNALWTVSDDTKKIFKLSLDGDLLKDKSFKIPDKELEGIALDPSGEFLLVVREDVNEIIKIKIDTQEVINRQPLANMAGYEAVAHFFSNGETNKGLEGITWNTETGTIFVIKEFCPGLLVEVSPDLQTILSHQLLNNESGFLDTELDSDEIDYSDICYDQGHNLFWIISDKARRLFLYDWKGNKVIHSSKLSYGKNGEYREIKSAEGIAIDSDGNRLYVVSDEKAKLYVFDIRYG